MFQTTDHYRLFRMLEAVPVPMFAAEREAASAPFRMLCVNSAHTEKTSLRNYDVRGRRLKEFMSEMDATALDRRLCRCIEAGHPITYDETLAFHGVRHDWNTTLKPVQLEDGLDRVIGVTITVDHRPLPEDFQDADYFAAVAQMQLGKLRHFLDLLDSRPDVPVDLRNTASMAADLTANIDTALADIRKMAGSRDGSTPKMAEALRP